MTMAISKHELGLAEMIAGEAYRAFDRWLAEHDPDGEMDLLEATADREISRCRANRRLTTTDGKGSRCSSN